MSLPIADFRFPIVSTPVSKSAIGNRKSTMSLLRFLVISVLAATTAELTELQPVRRGLLILGRNVVSILTDVTLKHNIVAWHKLFPISDCQLPIC